MTGNWIIACLAVLVASPGLAQTDCPTAENMQRGVRLTYTDGTTEVYRAMGDGLVVVDAVDYRMELARGTHLLRFEGIVDGVTDPATVMTYDFGIAPADMPLPEAGKRWSAPVVVTDSTGTRDEAQLLAYGQPDRVTIGDCSYDMFEVVIAYDREDMYMETLHYLPALGFTYLTWSGTMGDTPVTALPTGIEAIRK